MGTSTIRRAGALLTSAAMLAGLAIATAAPASAQNCTYTFPAGGGTYPGGTVSSGDILCGGPGVDVVEKMTGGVFYGRGGNDVVVDIDPSHTVIGDEARIRQVIRNLVTNAIKYGGTRIEITSELRGGTLHLSVVDDGDGIPSALKSELFNDYTQGANADPSTGFGLGLGISRRLAHLMQGDLVYEDAEPRGAHFTLALPAA